MLTHFIIVPKSYLHLWNQHQSCQVGSCGPHCAGWVLGRQAVTGKFFYSDMICYFFLMSQFQCQFFYWLAALRWLRCCNAGKNGSHQPRPIEWNLHGFYLSWIFAIKKYQDSTRHSNHSSWTLQPTPIRYMKDEGATRGQHPVIPSVSRATLSQRQN